MTEILLTLTLIGMVIAVYTFMEKESDEDVLPEVVMVIWGLFHLFILLMLDF